MKYFSFAELRREIDVLFENEAVVDWFVEGKGFGTPGEYPLWRMHLRDRAVELQLPTTIPGTGLTDREWPSGWIPIFTAIGLLPPEVDRVALLTYLTTKKHLCLVSDTSAVAGGVISWLARMRWDRPIEVILPMVAERELFGWADQDDFWKSQPDKWNKRAQYRLARRLSETPPPNIKVSRGMADERAALMLAKRTTSGEKSPDADILMIEMARDYIRTQPAGNHVFYVTGDRNHARSAMAILSAENVLFACNSKLNLNNKVFAQLAFWRGGPELGAVHRPHLGDVIWNLLCASDVVRIVGRDVEAVFSTATEGRGTPSEWQAPLFKIDCVRDSRPTSVTVAPVPDLEVVTVAPATESEIIPEAISTDLTTVVTPLGVQASLSQSHPIFSLSLTKLQELLNQGLRGEAVGPVKLDKEVERETFRFVIQIGAANEDGVLARDSDIWHLIRTNNWDTVHTFLKVNTGYGKIMDKLSRDPQSKRSSREDTNVALARRLGQAARLSAKDPVQLGDKLISSDELEQFLRDTLPIIGEDYAVSEVVREALYSLSVTPARFERYIEALLAESQDFLSFETAGTVPKHYEEATWEYEAGQITERKVGAAALYFGSGQPIRFLRRLR